MGAWIEITGSTHHEYICEKSHPTMGAWIEINLRDFYIIQVQLSHPTMGAWIEILQGEYLYYELAGRTPRWVRGLKFICFW